MADRPSLSKGEMIVVRALWSVGPAIVREIHAEIEKNAPIDFSTVQTYLRRLEKKGYASSRLKGRLRVFSARTRPVTVIRETVNDLIEKLFGGDSMPLVRHLIEDRGIDDAGIEELRELLDRFEAESEEDVH